MPVSETILLYYFSSLAERFITHATMTVYLSSIVYHSQQRGVPLKVKHMPRLRHLLRGIRRTQGGRLSRPRRQPVSLHHMAALRSFLSSHFHPYDARMLWAALTSALFGLLRASEFTSPSHSTTSPSTLLASHLSFSPNFSKATLFLPCSKTDQFGAGVSIPLFPLPSHLCPVSALAHFIALRRQVDGPLFLFADGTYLTRRHIVDTLRATFPAQPGLNTHSFRAGGASALASAGLPDYVIQIVGRWSSDSFLRYMGTMCSNSSRKL